jgi:hypothetical protein
MGHQLETHLAAICGAGEQQSAMFVSDYESRGITVNSSDEQNRRVLSRSHNPDYFHLLAGTHRNGLAAQQCKPP